MTRRERIAAVRAIYAEVPAIPCKGLCGDACGPIPVEGIERELMTKRDKRTKELPKGSGVARALEGHMCPHLTGVGRCRIYSVRPLICRLWGVTESLPCHHGCQPERVMTDVEGYVLIHRMRALDGDPMPSRGEIEAFVRELRDVGYFAALRPTHPMEKGHKSNTVKTFTPRQ